MAKKTTFQKVASVGQNQTIVDQGDMLGKPKKKTFQSGQRPVRDEATADENTRAVQIIERAQKMKAAKLLYSSRWWEYERAWKMLEEDRPDDEKWRANLPDTMAYASIMTAQAAFIDSQVVPVISKQQNDDMMRSSDLRDLYTSISKKGDIDNELYLARLDAFKLGTGFLFSYYEKDPRITWEIDSFDPETEKINYTRKVINRFDDVKSIRVSPYLVLVDETCRADFHATAKDAILIELITRSEAKMKYGHLFGSPEAFDKRVPTTNAVRTISSGDIQNRGIATTSNNNTRDVSAHTYTFFAPIELSGGNEGGLVEILHYFCVKPEDSYEILINGRPAQVKTDVWPCPLPWIHKEIPLTPIRWAIFSGDEFWGRGIIEASRADAKAHRENREMMSDRQRVSLFSPVFSDVADEIDQRLLKLKPLSVIRTRGGVPTQYKIPSITAADLQIQAAYETSLKRATGIDDQMIGGGNMGQIGTRRLTATAIAFLRQSLFMRLKDFQFLYKQSLIGEVRLKLKLFEQYYDSPLKKADKLKNEKGLKELEVKAKEFSVKVGDVYRKKTVPSTLFTGAIEDIDLDMNVLMPLTPAELITKWSQVIRDTTPFVQAGVVDLDLEKMLTEYLSALDVNIDTLRKDPDNEAISMADGEHEILANANTSEAMFQHILKDGTAPQFLTATHLKRHQQLLANEKDADKPELKRIIAHIAKDAENYKKKMEAQAKQMQDTNKLSGALGDFGAPDQGGGGGGARPPSVSMNYKDAPPDVQREIEEAAGLHPSQEPTPPQGKKPPLKMPNTRGGASAAITSPDDMPGFLSESAPGMNG